MNKEEILLFLKEAENHLINELLPFWTTRMVVSLHISTGTGEIQARMKNH